MKRSQYWNIIKDVIDKHKLDPNLFVRWPRGSIQDYENDYRRLMNLEAEYDQMEEDEREIFDHEVDQIRIREDQEQATRDYYNQIEYQENLQNERNRQQRIIENDYNRMRLYYDEQELLRAERKIREDEERRIRNNQTIDNYINNGSIESLNEVLNLSIHTPLTRQQAINLFNRLNDLPDKTVLSYDVDNDYHYITVNIHSRTGILNRLQHDLEYENDYVSDQTKVLRNKRILNIKIIKVVEPKRKFKNRNGGLFTYVNKTNIDLSHLQIYNSKQIKYLEFINKKAYGEEVIPVGVAKAAFKHLKEFNDPIYDNIKDNFNKHCFINTLELLGIEPKLIQRVVSMLGCKNLNKTLIGKKIAPIMERTIVVHSKDNKQILRKQRYGTGPEIHIGLINDHYIPILPTKYSKYSIENNDLTTVEGDRWTDEYKRGMYSKRERKLNSIQLINILNNNGCFSKKTEVFFLEGKEKEKTYLDAIDHEQQLFEHKPKGFVDEKTGKTKPFKRKKVYYCDIECDTTKEHRPIYIQIADDYSDVILTRIGPDDDVRTCINKAFKNIKDKSILYFHNMKYDITVLSPYLDIIDNIEKDGIYYQTTLIHEGKTFYVRDSLKLLPNSLSVNAKMMGIPYNKIDGLNYQYYDIKNNYNKRINVEDYYTLKQRKNKYDRAKYEFFIEDVKKCESYKNGTFNPWIYYERYAKMDVEVLRKTLQVFNEKIKSITNDTVKSIHDHLTISSIVDYYVKSNGCYGDVYEVCGNLRDFISRAINGGRVQVNEKCIKKWIYKKQAALDCCSLYPSAIKRACDEGRGIPLGKAKRWYKGVKYDSAVLEIKITKVNKKQQLPIISYREPDGSIKYTNVPPPVNVVVDAVQLDEYKKLHDIEYDIIDGLYWDEGFNNALGSLISNLYDTRMEAKSTGNKSLNNVVKLMLNSIYGKTIIKKSYIKTAFTNGERFNPYLYNNFNCVRKVSKLSDECYKFYMDTIDNSYNLCHVGVRILSYSKVIMNEVLDICNDNNIIVRYGDTDSLHINYEDITRISDLFVKKYNRALLGDYLGEFNNDFDDDGYSVKSMFLGTKSYLHKLELPDGSIDYKIRLKGVTKSGIDDAIERYDNIENIFDMLSDSKKVPFYLNPAGSSSFQFNHNSVNIKDDFSFIRELQF